MEIFNFDQLRDERIRSLILDSAKAREKAYAVYSNFLVGAALSCSDGNEVITGCNVENVSFGLTICAERTAAVKAVSGGLKKFDVIAVSGVSNSDVLVSPCGACRQFLSEFNPSLEIYLFDPVKNKVGKTTLQYLLPAAVLPGNLDKAIIINK